VSLNINIFQAQSLVDTGEVFCQKKEVPEEHLF